MVVWGYGPCEITDLKIGETPITDFDDVQVETFKGLPGDRVPSLYSSDVTEEQLSIVLTQANSWSKRTTATIEASAPDADEISISSLKAPRIFQAGRLLWRPFPGTG